MTTYPAQHGMDEFVIPEYSVNEEFVDTGIFEVTILEGECINETLTISNVSMNDDHDNTDFGVIEYDFKSSVAEDDSRREQMAEIARGILKSAIYYAIDSDQTTEDNEEDNGEDVAS